MNTIKLMHKGLKTLRELYTLQQLKERGKLPISEISVKHYLSTASLTDIIDKLEANGFVERNRCQLDRRKTFISLTPRGHELLAPEQD